MNKNFNNYRKAGIGAASAWLLLIAVLLSVTATNTTAQGTRATDEKQIESVHTEAARVTIKDGELVIGNGIPKKFSVIDSLLAPSVIALNAIYSNITTSTGTAVGSGGGSGTTGKTILVADDLHVTGTAPISVTGFKFSMVNINSAALSVRPTIYFYRADGASGRPGTLIASTTLNAVSVNGNRRVLVTVPYSFTLPVTTFWAGVAFDRGGNSTATTDAQLNNFSQGTYDPVERGSSQDIFFKGTTSADGANNPPGNLSFFGGNPTANLGWEITAAATVLSINRNNGNPRATLSTATWDVNFTTPVSGLTAANFTLATTGAASGTITSVLPNGGEPVQSWRVTANLGEGAGTVGLNLVNDANLNTTVTNLPFVGEVYTVFVPPLTVTKTADTDDGDCDADCSLREAIAAAGVLGNASISFASPLFDAPQTITLSDAPGFGELAVSRSVFIIGKGARLLTVRRSSTAARDFRIFNLANETNVSISGLTVSGGRADQGAGILKGAGGSLRLDFVTVSNNTAIGSSGSSGGGLDTFANTTITNSTFSGNSAQVDDSGDGGGIRVASGTTTIANSTVSGNSADAGGGIYNNGTLNLNNVTVTANSSGGNGGIYNNTGTTVNVRNTIIAGNAGGGIPDVFRAFNSLGNNLVGNTAGSTGFGGSGSNDKINVAAGLAALANNGGQTDTHALLANSPAIDAGNGCVVTSVCASINPPLSLTTDQRGAGFARRFDNTVVTSTGNSDGTDIGAFELQAAPTAATVSISGRVITPDGRGLINARVTLTEQNGTTRAVSSTSFGYFNFVEVQAGETVIITVISKRYTFAAQVFSVTEDLTELNFVGQPSRRQL